MANFHGPRSFFSGFQKHLHIVGHPILSQVICNLNYSTSIWPILLIFLGIDFHVILSGMRLSFMFIARSSFQRFAQTFLKTNNNKLAQNQYDSAGIEP